MVSNNPVNGFLTNLTLDAADSVNVAGQRALIRSSHPSFSWVLSNEATTRRQTAFRLLLSSSSRNNQANVGDVWDSGKVKSGQSVDVLLPATHHLDANKTYYWKVKSWDDQNHESAFSASKAFRTASTLTAYQTPFYPLVKVEEAPRSQRKLGIQQILYGFGNDAFG